MGSRLPERFRGGVEGGDLACVETEVILGQLVNALTRSGAIADRDGLTI